MCGCCGKARGDASKNRQDLHKYLFPLDRPMTPQQKQVGLSKARGEPSPQHRREQDKQSQCSLPCIKDYFFTPRDCILITAAVPFSISPSNLILLFLVCAFPPYCPSYCVNHAPNREPDESVQQACHCFCCSWRHCKFDAISHVLLDLLAGDAETSF